MTVYGSANKMALEYFNALGKLVQDAQVAENPDEERRATMLAVVHSVTFVEAFLNLWFRVRVEGVPSHRASFLEDLKTRRGLEYKLNKWPPRYLSKTLNLNSGPGGEFSALKELRNSLVHFTNTYESIDVEPNVIVHGLADITAYDALSKERAIRAQATAEEFIAEIFRLAGTVEEKIPHALHAWIGEVPI